MPRVQRKPPIPSFRRSLPPSLPPSVPMRPEQTPQSDGALRLKQDINRKASLPLPASIARRRGGSRPVSASSSVAPGSRPASGRRAGTSNPASRFPKEYSKLGELGRGGFGVVYDALGPDGREVAVKQVPKRSAEARSALKAANNEVVMAEMLWGPGAPTTEEVEDGGAHPQELFAQLHRVIDMPSDLWLVFSKGGQPLSKLLFELKGEFHKGERVYRNKLKPFYLALRDDRRLLVGLIRRMVQSVALMATRGVVHADFKPDNILVRPELDPEHEEFYRLVDFGSAFAFDAPDCGNAATPEYLAPELAAGVDGDELQRVLEAGGGHAADMWSVGCVVLEIAAGCPIWFPYKTRVGSGNVWTSGLFAASGRSSTRIAEHQSKVVGQLGARLARCCPLELDDDPEFIDLLLGMLQLRPEERLCPAEVLDHPFMQAYQ